MGLAEIGQSIQGLRIFTAVRESTLVYPILLSTHLACLAIFGGLILFTNLRLLGWMLTEVPADDLIRALRPWKQAGFVVMIGAGTLLGGSKAGEYFTNPFFQIKMLLLAGVGIHGLSFRGSVYRRPGGPRSAGAARAAAVLSVVLWTGVASMGRWIAYYDRPEPTAASTSYREQSAEDGTPATGRARHNRQASAAITAAISVQATAVPTRLNL